MESDGDWGGAPAWPFRLAGTGTRRATANPRTPSRECGTRCNKGLRMTSRRSVQRRLHMRIGPVLDSRCRPEERLYTNIPNPNWETGTTGYARI